MTSCVADAVARLQPAREAQRGAQLRAGGRGPRRRSMPTCSMPIARSLSPTVWRQMQLAARRAGRSCRRVSTMKCEHTPGRSCSSTSGALEANVFQAEEKRRGRRVVLDDHLRVGSAVGARAVVALGVGAHLGAAGGAERDRGARRCAAARRDAAAAARRGAPGRPRACRRAEAALSGAGGQLDHERARAGERVVLPARGGAVVVRQPRARAGRRGARRRGPRAGRRRADRFTSRMCWWYQTVTAGPDARDEPPHRARLRLRERAPAREVGVERRARRRAQRHGKLRLRSTPRAFWRVPRADAVGVDGVDEPQLDAGGRRRVPQAARSPRARRSRCRGSSRRRAPSPAPSPTRSARSGRSAAEWPNRSDAAAAARASTRGTVASAIVMDSIVIVGAGTFGASLAWWLARDGVRRHARRPVRARRPPRDLGRRDAPDPLRPRRGRRLHRVGPPRAHAVARARGGVRRRPADRVRAGVVRPPRRRLGGGVRGDHARPGHPGRAARASRRARGCSRASSGDDLAFLLHEPEAGVLRAQRAVQTLAAQAAAHGAKLVQRPRRARGGRACVVERRRGSRPTRSCGPAAAGCAQLFPELVTRARRRARTCSSSTAASRGRTRPGWVDYDGAVYGTGDLDGLGVKGAPDFEGPPLAPDDDAPAQQPGQRALDPRLLRRAASRRSPTRR